jgi:hypothetical protein
MSGAPTLVMSANPTDLLVPLRWLTPGSTPVVAPDAMFCEAVVKSDAETEGCTHGGRPSEPLVCRYV